MDNHQPSPPTTGFSFRNRTHFIAAMLFIVISGLVFLGKHDVSSGSAKGSIAEKVQSPRPASKGDTESKPVTHLEQGAFRVDTDPAGATVFIGGKKQGSTPFITQLNPGEYQLLLKKDGYEELHSRVRLEPQSGIDFDAQMIPVSNYSASLLGD